MSDDLVLQYLNNANSRDINTGELLVFQKLEEITTEYIRLKAIEQAAKDFLTNFPYYADLMDIKTEIDFKNLKELLQID